MIVKDYYFFTPEKLKYPHHPFIDAIGYEYRAKDDEERYDRNCYQKDESVCIFQYTVAGEGLLEVNGKRHKQTRGSIFIVERPGQYRYRLPENSAFWEFKFINFSFAALPFWNAIVGMFGRTFKIQENSELMRYWDELFERVINMDVKKNNNADPSVYIHPLNPFETVFDNSRRAYELIMMLHTHLIKHGVVSSDMESIQLCLEFIHSNYKERIGNLDIANAGFISPYYLIKRFKDVIGETPVHYLTKLRIKQAMMMLQNPKNTVNDIARECGFQNGNYFTKVFKKFTNLSPSEYRAQKKNIIVT